MTDETTVKGAKRRIQDALDLIENASFDLQNFRVQEQIQHYCDEIRQILPDARDDDDRAACRSWRIRCQRCSAEPIMYTGPEPVLCPRCQYDDIDTEPAR